MASSLTASTATSSQHTRQQNVEALAPRACSLLMMLCTGTGSSAAPGIHAVFLCCKQPHPSALSKQRLPSCAGAQHDCTCKVAGQHLKCTSTSLKSACCHMRIERSSMPFTPDSARFMPLWSPSSRHIPMCKVQFQYTCRSGCSSPYCSLMPCMAVKSGPWLMQQLACFRGSRICSIPFFAMQCQGRFSHWYSLCRAL